MKRWLPILTYHRVCDQVAPQDPYCLCTSVAGLERTLRYFRDHRYQVVPLARAFEIAHDGIRGRFACLTFDDGYEDFYTHAMPLLKKYACPATVLLVTDYLGDFNRWENDTRLPVVPLLSREGVLSLAREGIGFGAHGATHRRLTSLPIDERRREIYGSRETLEALLDREVQFFAYPYVDQDANVRAEVKEAGYLGALGGEQYANEAFVMHRIDISGLSWPATILRLRGWRYRLQRNSVLRRAKSALRTVSDHTLTTSAPV